MRSPRHLALALILAAHCKRDRTAPDAATAVAPRDGGQRIAVTEAAPLGPSADRRERDVPLDWIYLLTDPAPTGRTPYAVVGARLPCGYEPLYLTSEKDGSRVKVRLRARWSAATPVPPTLPDCGDRPVKAWLVSEGVLRVGDWEVVDIVPHGPGDPPQPTARVQRVVPEDARLPPLVARWVRGCSTDADCHAGGVCAELDGAALCLPPVDPWLGHGRPCVDGATVAEVRHRGDGGTRSWQACVAACENHGCPTGLTCSAADHCVPAPAR